MALLSHPPTPGRVYLPKVQQSPKATPPEGDLIFKHMTLCGYLLLKQQYKRWMECWEHSWKTHFTVQITCKSWDKKYLSCRAHLRGNIGHLGRW